ncbi:MAG: RimK/LysX family protein [Brumimicrobium sp.]|nr:RimK/LysX family protein [Brumimicrobium sp.]
MKRKQKPIIGKDDIADFPLFGLTNVRVKIDSGAYTSTIHCSRIRETDEGLFVVFLDKKEKGYTGTEVHFTKYDRKKVRSSSGELQERYIVKGDIELFGKKIKTEFTLSKRNLMRYPVLLGRKLLNKRFLIDTSLSNQSAQLKTATIK